MAGRRECGLLVVGDRKQSIYGFRDADVSVLGDAVRFLHGLRPGYQRQVKRLTGPTFISAAAISGKPGGTSACG